jgi:hypothetical protein
MGVAKILLEFAVEFALEPSQQPSLEKSECALSPGQQEKNPLIPEGCGNFCRMAFGGF